MHTNFINWFLTQIQRQFGEDRIDFLTNVTRTMDTHVQKKNLDPISYHIKTLK